MSNINNKLSLQEIALSQVEARKEYEKRTAEFNEQLKTKISNYNTVVSNTLNKFRSDYELWSTLRNQLLISADSVIADYAPYNDEYIFESKGNRKYVPGVLLRNDPIAVAIYTRQHIRKFQEAAHGGRYKTAKAALDKANRELKAAQKTAETAQKAMDVAEAQSKKYEARVMARIEKKMKAKAAARTA